MTTGIDPQEFGRMQAELATLRRDSDRQLELLTELTKETTAIRQQLAEARGGWKVLMLLGGSAASVGGGVMSESYLFSNSP